MEIFQGKPAAQLFAESGPFLNPDASQATKE
jgi:hypothetical protein